MNKENLHQLSREYADTIEVHPCAHRSGLITGFEAGYKQASESNPNIKPPTTTRTPHICPVCGGNGLVPNGFYSHTSGQWSTTSETAEQCKSCIGRGIIII
jgi:hypothetical protein